MESNIKSGFEPPDAPASGVSRRRFLQWSALAGASLGLVSRGTLADGLSAATADAEMAGRPDFRLREATIVRLQRLMERGRLTARQLVALYLDRIRRIDQQRGLNSVLELNPDALDIARQLDRERRQNGPRGPLHG
nr:twin-arginine translocation signal domain-containing protein [Gammaproteobacteria bacterium]